MSVSSPTTPRCPALPFTSLVKPRDLPEPRLCQLINGLAEKFLHQAPTDRSRERASEQYFLRDTCEAQLFLLSPYATTTIRQVQGGGRGSQEELVILHPSRSFPGTKMNKAMRLKKMCLQGPSLTNCQNWFLQSGGCCPHLGTQNQIRFASGFY